MTAGEGVFVDVIAEVGDASATVAVAVSTGEVVLVTSGVIFAGLQPNKLNKIMK